MRYQWLKSPAVVATATVLFAVPLVAAEKSRYPGVSEVSPIATSIDTDAKPKTAAPSPAKHKSGLQLLREADSPNIQLISDAAPLSAEQTGNTKSTPPAPKAEPAKVKPAEASLKPTPEASDNAPVTLEPASFKGITPGLSTQTDVVHAWGQPKEMAKQNGELVQLYSIAPFKRVEVSYAGEKVVSVLVRFDRAFPVDTVAKQLDLTAIRPVLVSGDLGESLGLSYPERGVLFAFEADQKTAEKPSSVAQLILEPITAEPFVLRAETTLESHPDLCRRDLDVALSLDPENARAHWLNSRILVTSEQFDKAVAESGRAVQIEPANGRYQVTHAQVLAQVGRLSEAMAAAQKAVAASEKQQHTKARALCLVGDLAASGPTPDYKKALSSHTQALQTADTMVNDQRPTIRVAAKEVLIDSHLGAAHDIAWGDWKEKDKAVARWLDRAVTMAEDLVKNEKGNSEQVFHVYVRALAAYVGLRGSVDPEPMVKSVTTAGDNLIAATRDPGHKAQLQWDLGLALYDAVQISQMRSDHENALKYAEKAAEYLTKANEVKNSSASAFLLGRLYYRIGSIHATREKDHRVAITWFDKAIPLLERPSAEDLAADLGRHGESFVSMGVSYWEAGQRQKAITLSERGIRWMEQAVKQDLLQKSALAIPYNNLAAMHRKVGSNDKADRYQQMAAGAKKEKQR